MTKHENGYKKGHSPVSVLHSHPGMDECVQTRKNILSTFLRLRMPNRNQIVQVLVKFCKWGFSKENIYASIKWY